MQRWFKHVDITPISFRAVTVYRLMSEGENRHRAQCPRRFRGIDPEMLHTCLVGPCRGFYVFFVFFPPDIWVFVFLGYSNLKGSHIPRENRQHSLFVKSSVGAH